MTQAELNAALDQALARLPELEDWEQAVVMQLQRLRGTPLQPTPQLMTSIAGIKAKLDA